MVHKNLRLPCDSLPVEDPEPKADRKTATNIKPKQQRLADLDSESEDSGDEDEHEMVLRFSHHSQPSRTASLFIITPNHIYQEQRRKMMSRLPMYAYQLLRKRDLCPKRKLNGRSHRSRKLRWRNKLLMYSHKRDTDTHKDSDTHLRC